MSGDLIMLSIEGVLKEESFTAICRAKRDDFERNGDAWDESESANSHLVGKSEDGI
jgi:hypothetical protein